MVHGLGAELPAQGEVRFGARFNVVVLEGNGASLARQVIDCAQAHVPSDEGVVLFVVRGVVVVVESFVVVLVHEEALCEWR